MLETAFTLLGTDVTWLEAVAFVLALANIACNVFEIHWGWPLTIVASALYAWLFFASKLYGETGVNLFFAFTAVWGWWQWLGGSRGYEEDTAPLAAEHLAPQGTLWLLLSWAALWLVCSQLLQHITDSDVAWVDGFVTAGSVVGTFLLGRKFIANWPVWLVVNAASMALFAYKGLALTVVLYAFFFVLAIWGWVGWHRRLQSRLAAVTATTAAASSAVTVNTVDIV